MRRLEDLDYEPAGRLLLEISFDGTEYSGWQTQAHCLCVQQVIERTLSNLFAGLPINLTGSSRTDAGVHALGFAASFVIPGKPYIPVTQIKKALNRLLPRAIRVRNIFEVPLEFHARYDAKGKAYTYILNLGEETPFSSRYSWLTRMPVDIEKLQAGAKHLIGTHDFSSFVVERSKIEDAVRTVYDINLKMFGNYACITFIGNGFLYKMIRCMMGTLEAVGTGRLEPDEVRHVLGLKQRSMAPETAPPHGLFLMKVFYDEADIGKFELKQVPFFAGM